MSQVSPGTQRVKLSNQKVVSLNPMTDKESLLGSGGKPLAPVLWQSDRRTRATRSCDFSRIPLEIFSILCK